MKKRIQRVNQLIKREISQILLKEIDFPRDILVTVTKVETSADLNLAKIFLSVMPEDKFSEIFQTLSQRIYQIQKILNKKLKMKFTPKIEFREEKKTREAGRVEEILEQLKKEENEVK